MTASIAELVEKFSHNFAEYKNPKYNETQVRVEFVNPFWEALGWDVNNVSGHSLAFRDVIHEDEVRVGTTTKAPDYSFRIGGKRIFFLETKKPSVDLKNDPAPAFQLRRYAYSAKLPVSILTDFEEFIVYDTTLKPAITDKTHVGRMLYYTYQEYVENWESIHAAFSKEAVLRGDFERFLQSKQGKKPRAEIDRDFLNDLDNWRIKLAHNIALRNLNLSERELNYAVQMTIDRLIFLRMSEDRGIETQYPLQSLLNGERVYPRLVEIYYRADERYNSGLFHFTEKDGTNPDTITPMLTIDDKSLKEIVRNLYYPDCPYEFSVLPVEVLGNAYEQFLGKRISLTAGHHARIEEKPEVRKAGGVYYTPQYIVDYIVKNTVGSLLENKTPAEVSELRILDPACGSGSFLLGAFQYLMDWHLEYYRRDYEKTGIIPIVKAEKGKRKTATQAIFSGKGGDWFLSTPEKKRILLNNLYGVDIDSNAVEVTKLSLLLKVLENENSETLARQLGLWHERALPNLANNIKCGNSLIGPDYYEHQQASLFDEKEALRINVFDWEKEFPEIFSPRNTRKDTKGNFDNKSGGFDAVIGNPPWGAEFLQETRHYLAEKFNVSVNIADSFILFVNQSLLLIKKHGLQGFIIPSTWLYMPTYTTFRKSLLSNYKFQKILLFRKPVFKDAIVETCIEILEQSKTPNNKFDLTEIKNNSAEFIGNSMTLEQKILIEQEEANFLQNDNSKEFRLFSKISKKGTIFGKASRIVCGLTPYRKGKGKPPQTQTIVENKSYDSNYKVDKTYRQYLMGRDFHRYTWNIQESRWISYGNWLAEPRYAAPFDEKVKIVIRQTADSIIAQIDENQYLSLKNVHNVKILDKDLNYSYLLGLLNSKVMTWWYRQLIPEKGRVFAEVKVVNLEKLPIRAIDFDNPADKARHDRMVSLVETMLALHKRLPEVNTPPEKEVIQRQITATDAQIDKLVYELYGLTEEEIKVVENV